MLKYCVVNTEEECSRLLQKLESLDNFAIDLETTSLNPRLAKILCVSISWKEETGIVIPIELIEKFHVQFNNILKGNSLKIGHNIKFDIEVLKCNGYEINGPYFDTMLAHHLIDENIHQGLDVLVLEYNLGLGPYWLVLDDERKRICKEEGILREDFSYALFDKDMLYCSCTYPAGVPEPPYTTDDENEK